MANQVFRFYSTAPLIVFHHARIFAGDRVVRLDGRGLGGPAFWLMVIVIEESEGAVRFASWLDRNSREQSFMAGWNKKVMRTGPLHRPSLLRRLAFWAKNSAEKRQGVIKPL